MPEVFEQAASRRQLAPDAAKRKKEGAEKRISTSRNKGH